MEVIKIKKFRLILKILMVISLCIFPLFMNLMSGIALICNAQINRSGGLIEYSDFIEYRNMGTFMVSSSIMMLFATICIFIRKNFLGVIIETIGFAICMVVLLKLRKISEINGLSDNNMTPYSEIYFWRHFPTAVHAIIVYLLALTGHFESKTNLADKKLCITDEVNNPKV